MFERIYEEGKDKMYARLNEALDAMDEAIERKEVEPVGWDEWNGEPIYPEASDFEDEIWESLMDAAINQAFSFEEFYYSVYETDGEAEADDLVAEWDYRTGQVA